MSRKGRRKQQAKAKRPAPPPSFTLGRFYRFHRETFHKVFSYTGLAVGAIAVIVVAIWLLQRRSTSLTKSDYLREARKSLALGYFDQAVVSYHQAENADPADEKIKREISMARTRAELSQGGQISRAIDAAAQVLADDSTLAIAHAGLAQLHSGLGNLKLGMSYARAALRFGEAEGDIPSTLAASLVLESGYRQTDVLDSAVAFGEQAVDQAHVVGDRTNLALAEVGAGFSLLRQDKLEKGRLFFEDVIAMSGGGNSYFDRIAKVGLADYFFRAGLYDSAIFYASPIESGSTDSTPNELSALASQVLGKTLRGKGDLTNALLKLNSSLVSWQSLRSQAYLIDNLNDLAETYYAQKDYFNARKYYYAAARLADKYGFVKKDHYDANMNLRFLKFLSQVDYLRAGDEGSALVAQYSLWQS